MLAVSETKLKENMIYSKIELDGYQFITVKVKCLLAVLEFAFKNSVSLNMKSNISIELPSVENFWIEIEINRKTNCRRCLPLFCPNGGAH